MATTAIEQLSMWSSFPKWLHIVSLWFTGTERWRARAYVSVCALISVLTTAFAVQISYAQRRFSTALSERDVEGFHAAVWQFVAIICIAAPLAAIDGYVQGRLVLAWRAYLTRRLVGAYFDRNAFFHLKLLSATAADSDDGMPARLDNPDMRITDDVNSFTSASTGLLLGLLRKVLNCIAFAGVLWSISPSLVLFLFLYAGLGTWVTGTVFGRKLMALKWRHLQREGDLRFSLTRVRDNAESIAFINGSAREAATVNHRVDDLVGIVKSRILWGGFLDLWTGSYSYATILLPSILTAPRYFAREVEFGVISQAGYAFGRIEAALSIIVDQLETMSGLAAQVDRLDTLFSALRHSAGTGDEYSLDSGSALGKSTIERLPLALSSGDSVGQTLLKMDNLTLQLPGSTTTVCNSLSLSLSDGESLLIAGPSGCGKSSLLRAVAGLWSRGSGVVRYPSDTSALDGGMFFLPQKPYMMLGSLRQQLEFPSELAAPEKLLLSLLDVVNLADLPERVGGMDRQIDWQHVLSVGEQQRLGFVRLLLHRPRLAFLDEATSALDPQSETRMYSELRRTCRCFVSVGHRPALVQYHSLVLRNCAPGQWELLSRQQYQQRMDLADADTTDLP